MPLNKKGKKILKSMKEQYGPKAKQVFYASLNKGVIKNVEKKEGGGLSGGKRFGPPPEKGPNPQGLKIQKMMLGNLAKGSGVAQPVSGGSTGGGGFGGMGLMGKLIKQNPQMFKNFSEEEEELKITKAYLGKEIRQPTETKKEFGTRHEIHTKLKESDIYRKGSKVSDASPKLKQGGMSCPYRRGGKTSIQGVSKIQVKGQKFIGVR